MTNYDPEPREPIEPEWSDYSGRRYTREDVERLQRRSSHSTTALFILVLAIVAAAFLLAVLSS